MIMFMALLFPKSGDCNSQLLRGVLRNQIWDSIKLSALAWREYNCCVLAMLVVGKVSSFVTLRLSCGYVLPVIRPGTVEMFVVILR